MADEREHYGWGRIMQDRDLISALEKMGGVVIQPHQRKAGFQHLAAQNPPTPKRPKRDEDRS